MLHGRILAEEGTTYLRYAWDATPLHALLAPHQGYYSLLDNLCALIAARLLPLSAAALFFTWTAVAVQLLLLFLAIECEVFRTPIERCCALFALLLVTPNFEVWLNLENCQSLLAVAAAIVLISSARRLFAIRTATLCAGGALRRHHAAAHPALLVQGLERAFAPRPRLCAQHHAPCVSASRRPRCTPSAPAVALSPRTICARSWHTPPRASSCCPSPPAVAPNTTAASSSIIPDIGWIFALYLASAALLVLGFLLFRRSSPAALFLYFGALLSSVFDWYGCLACTFSRLPFSSGGEGRYFFAANAMLSARIAARRHARHSATARACRLPFSSRGSSVPVSFTTSACGPISTTIPPGNRRYFAGSRTRANPFSSGPHTGAPIRCTSPINIPIAPTCRPTPMTPSPARHLDE